MSDSLFQIMGPVMVGPSSSHTAGAVRLANLARLIAGKPIVSVEFVLYNSFAKTYRGHGTDRGLLAGILGYGVEDPIIRDIFDHVQTLANITPNAVTNAVTNALPFSWKITPCEDKNHYSPNTVKFLLTLQNDAEGTEEETMEATEQMTIVGHSIGGGSVYVSRINNYHVNLKGEQPSIILFYKDQPGMIWQVTKVIAEHHINIATLQCSRNERAGQAFMSITLDSMLPEAAATALRDIGDVYFLRCLDKLAS